MKRWRKIRQKSKKKKKINKRKKQKKDNFMKLTGNLQMGSYSETKLKCPQNTFTIHFVE